MTFLSRYQSILLSIFRIVAGLLVLQHGTTKLLHFPASQMSGISLTSPPGLAGIFELVCGALVVLGLFTRPAAFLLAGMTAVAYFMVHLPQGIYPLLNGGELVALYCFAFLYITAAGPGPISLDAAMGHQEQRE